MVWHIHFKDGKFAIWSTIVDDYITEWGTEEEVKQGYLEGGHTGDIDAFIRKARENKGCSFRTSKKGDLEIEERIGRMNNGKEPMVDF
jgi:hypothetical protein